MLATDPLRMPSASPSLPNTFHRRTPGARPGPLLRCLPGALLLLGTLLATPAAAEVDTDVVPDLDVPFVPTPMPVVERMLELGQVEEGDYVIDLGSGDGRIAVSAAERGARVLGVDLDPERIRESNQRAEQAGVSERAEFRQQDLFETDFSQADVLTMYLLPSVNLELRPKILDTLAPGTRVVSHAFDMGDWPPDHTDTVSGRTVYLWVVPARVEGRWNVETPQGDFTLELEQRYQQLQGMAQIEGEQRPLEDAELRGETIVFTLDHGDGPKRFVGRVDGDTIEASTADDERLAEAVTQWQARRS